MIKQVKMRDKIILGLLLVFIFSYMKQYTNNKMIEDAFNELQSKTITSIHVYKSSFWIDYEFDITDPVHIDKIISDICELDKSSVPIEDFLSWEGKYRYTMTFEDDHKTPHKTHVEILGHEYIEIRIYDYDLDTFKHYRAKIKIDKDADYYLSNLINEYWICE